MNGEFWSHILADVCNLLSHMNIRKPIKHTNSCLLCQPTFQKQCSNSASLYAALSSNDLEVVKSQKRGFVVFDGKSPTEIVLDKYLRTYLGFVLAERTVSYKQFLTLVVFVLDDTEVKFEVETCEAKKIIMFVPRHYSVPSISNKQLVFIEYIDFEMTINSVIHGFLLHKQRVRITDLNDLLAPTIGQMSFFNINAEECVFF